MPYTARQTRHGRSTRIILDGSNLSCYLREASLSTEMPTSDATAFCDSIQQFVTGLPNMTATLSGMFDTSDAGLDTIIATKFGDEGSSGYLNVVLANEGLQLGRRARGFSGIITSYNLQNTVTDLVSAQMNMQGVGELYVMTNVLDFNAVFAAGASAQQAGEFDRQVNGAGTKLANANSFYLYVHARNAGTNAVTVQMQTRATSGGATTGLGTAVTVPAAVGGVPGVFAGLVPVSGTNFLHTITARFLTASITNPTGNPNFSVYAALVDPDQSLIAL